MLCIFNWDLKIEKQKFKKRITVLEKEKIELKKKF